MDSKDLSKSDRSKLQGALNALGAPGKDNGVHIGFASKEAMEAKEGGHSAIGYTEKGKNGSINVTLRADYPKLYDGMPRNKTAIYDYRNLSPRDERAGAFVHEGAHVEQFQGGLSQQRYNANPYPYEDEAYSTGKLINKAYGSTSIYDSNVGP